MLKLTQVFDDKDVLSRNCKCYITILTYFSYKQSFKHKKSFLTSISNERKRKAKNRNARTDRKDPLGVPKLHLFKESKRAKRNSSGKQACRVGKDQVVS